VTVTELADHFIALREQGKGERVVYMGDPTTNEYAVVTGIWVPDDDEVVELESIEWKGR